MIAWVFAGHGSYKVLKSNARSDLYPSKEGIRNVFMTIANENCRFARISASKHFGLSLIEEFRVPKVVQIREENSNGLARVLQRVAK
jgi:hypothetical protein